MAIPLPIAQFRVGDRVKAISFTDCFGKIQPEVRGLTVYSVEAVVNDCSHWRLVAIGPDGLNYHEGAHRFFAAD